MRRFDEQLASPRKTPDLAAVIALVWALGFGAFYAEMIVRTKMPRLASAIRRGASQLACNPIDILRR